MSSTRYTVLGWLVWQVASRVARRKIAQNRMKLGVAGAVAVALVGAAVAAKAIGSDD